MHLIYITCQIEKQIKEIGHKYGYIIQWNHHLTVIVLCFTSLNHLSEIKTNSNYISEFKKHKNLNNITLINQINNKKIISDLDSE